jgi:ligand-binding SRPBCC domain-containing protein
MQVHVLRREQRLAASPEAVFPFFADPANLEAITPPLLRFRLITPAPVDMGPGTFLQYALRVRGVPVAWDTLIQSWQPPTGSSTCRCAAPTGSGTTRTSSSRWRAGP